MTLKEELTEIANEMRATAEKFDAVMKKAESIEWPELEEEHFGVKIGDTVVITDLENIYQDYKIGQILTVVDFGISGPHCMGAGLLQQVFRPDQFIKIVE